MAENSIEVVLDHLKKIKCGGDMNSVRIDQMETLEMELRFFKTFINYSDTLVPNVFFMVKMKKKAQLIEVMFYSVHGETETTTYLNVESLVSQLREFVEGNTSSRLNYELDDFHLLEYMDYLNKNLNDALRYLVKSGRVLIKEIKMLQKKMRYLRYLYGTELNSYVDHEKLKGLRTRIQFMAENVGHFCLSIWVYNDDADLKEDEEDVDLKEDEDDADLKEDEDDADLKEDENDTDKDLEEDGDDTFCFEIKPPYLLFLVVLVELEMKKIFLSELKASKLTRSRTFKDKKLPKIFLDHLRSLLVYLRDKKPKKFITNVSAQNIDDVIEFLLVFLGEVPNDVINEKRLNEALEMIGVLVGDILCVVQMLPVGSTIREDTNKILEKIEDLKARVETYYKSLKFIPSHEFPTVGGLSFVDSLLRKLNEMLKSETGLGFMMKPHIGILEKELSSLTYVFKDAAKVQHEHEVLKDFQKYTVSLAYEAEVAIDFILVQYNVLEHCFCSLPGIIKEIKHIYTEVTKMWSKNLSVRPYSVVELSKHLPIEYSNLMNDEEIVGFEKAEETISHHLTRGTNKLDAIPIVGMGGQGKTTCARKLYNNVSIVHHFDVRAWCIISQTYNRRELLQVIFSQVIGSKDNGDKDDVLAKLLRRSLMSKRYLIVLDDMWDCMAWDDLRLCFPDDGNRSRIVITTRLEKVGAHVMHHIDPYFLPFLTPEESCQLLQKKVFQQEGCPPELQNVSLALAKRCKGLPLVVILAAGIIKRNKVDESWWREVQKALFSYLDCETEDYSRASMLLSYDNLPDYLKPCLLYMGMFPEDVSIRVSKLISLWIAEGFIQNSESGRLMEEEAEGYLMDLIHSNVVMVSTRGYNSKVKYCHVHDVVLHFCLEKSREEKFMLVVKANRYQFRPYDWNENRVSFSFNNERSKFASLRSKTRTKTFYQHLRSLIMTNGVGYEWNPFRHDVYQLILVKVLDLSSHSVALLRSAQLQPLIHLKYLAVNTLSFSFHPEFHLPHLETLFLNCHCASTLLPAIFWKMEKLRHVEISSAEFDLENNKQGIFEECSKLENLRTLGNVVFPIDQVDSPDVLSRRCPNLQELHISVNGDNDSAEICLKLESFKQLHILRLNFIKSSQDVSKLQLPSNLKKLVLYRIHIESMIPVIAGLPNLEYLQLAGGDLIQSKEWSLGDITLHKLKLLKLVSLGISRWDASEESFPQLETLVIKRCDELEEIPISFAYISTLKLVKLIQYKNKFLEASAERIKEEVEAIEGCDRLNLIIMEDS
ncbi:putative late blight resistance protein homolog R1A-3 [Solanum tuberosum]|uniref:putative late blight resistance protein homolog R1A-3 n=1 Tax=Solanum tuberosum TaxID=4113 RepID=UPI0003D29911|nr:PREDICTED: putative late blight resistance protein homolog R1A-3 [Solanum tuberosum]